MRIAIYVRKSKWTGRGESIENQILMCREYIEKFIEDSREAEILVYSDEGFSGKDTNRPQFQKMLEDMKQGPFQYLVCYRLDRLGRNLADLALLIEKLNREHTEFVSIKEHFDTSTPMGKAMLYFSGVLAQMEREQIGERVRDNMFLLAKSGRWLVLSGRGRKRSRNPPPDLPGVFKLPFPYENSPKAYREKNLYKKREGLYAGDYR